mgnify:CR=1 FL=1
MQAWIVGGYGSAAVDLGSIVLPKTVGQAFLLAENGGCLPRRPRSWAVAC